MASYLSVMLTPTAMNWLMSLALDSIGSWEQLKKFFTDNYMATCTRPGTKDDDNDNGARGHRPPRDNNNAF